MTITSCCGQSEHVPEGRNPTPMALAHAQFLFIQSACLATEADVVSLEAWDEDHAVHDTHGWVEFGNCRGKSIVQAPKDCVAQTLKRLEEKIHKRILNHLLYLMRVSEKGVQRRSALALAHLCSKDDQRKVLLITMVLICSLGFLAHMFLSSNLMVLLTLCKLANKALTLSPVDTAPPSPTPHMHSVQCLLVAVGRRMQGQQRKTRASTGKQLVVQKQVQCPSLNQPTRIGSRLMLH
ncbi:hypothetical protein VNO77_27290 [Canavalia gladiata]|uniref:Uncharacterized protein n=1 Tax=Canavalia gladiata TaxID=3824 RepID=A0AAN9KYK7_CANGL